MGKDFNPPSPKGDPAGPCFDPACMDMVAGLINGCAKAVHVGSLADADTDQFPVGGLIYNADGMQMMEVWNGDCPVALPYSDGFVSMIVTLPDGSRVKAASRDEDTCKLTWEAMPPLADLDCDAIWACILSGSDENLQALCDRLPVGASEVTAAKQVKK